MRQTWAPTGQPPVLRRVSQRREVSSIIAITPGGRLAARHVPGAVHGPDVVRALRHFQHVFGRRLLIVWDRATPHRDRRVQRFLAEQPGAIVTRALPSYAPDLNPEEQANGIIKGRTANALPATERELKAHACRAVRYLQRHPEIVRTFFQHAGLDVN